MILFWFGDDFLLVVLKSQLQIVFEEEISREDALDLRRQIDQVCINMVTLIVDSNRDLPISMDCQRVSHHVLDCHSIDVRAVSLEVEHVRVLVVKLAAFEVLPTEDVTVRGRRYHELNVDLVVEFCGK